MGQGRGAPVPENTDEISRMGRGAGRPGGIAGCGQQEANGTATRPGGWTLTVAPYLWAAELEGDVTLGGVDADVDQDFDEILDDLVFGAMMLVDARHDRFGIAVNGFYVRTDADSDAGPLDIGATTDSAAPQAAAYYRVLELRPGRGEGVTLGIEPYAGARLTYVRAELQGGLALSVGIDREADRSETWVDPIVAPARCWTSPTAGRCGWRVTWAASAWAPISPGPRKGSWITVCRSGASIPSSASAIRRCPETTTTATSSGT